MANNTTPSVATRRLQVHASEDFRASCGANEGDALSFAADLVLDDVYRLEPQAQGRCLALIRDGGAYRIAPGSEIGTPGNAVLLDCAVTLMEFGASVTEMLVLVEIAPSGLAARVHLLPLAPLKPGHDYSLLRIETADIERKLAHMACVSFTRGTFITLGTGEQRAVEDLRPGDNILTRDDGLQPLRWIGQHTLRATGAFAPVRIVAGALNNARDLVVSPDHRLFIYQRRDAIGVGRAELMIRARQLVNGSTVRVEEGGFVDYFQLLFDRHQIIYAEGIAAESMIFDDATAPLLDPSVIELDPPAPALLRELSDLEVRQALVARPDAADLLREASRG